VLDCAWGSSLVLLAFLFGLSLDTVDSDLFVVLLQSSKILTSLGELSLLHTLSHIPVDEGTLGVHEIELVVKTSPGLSDGSGVGQHAHGALDLGEITTGDDGGWLVVDSDLETSGTPVDELDGTLGLNGSNGSIHVLGNDVTAVQHAACHVLSVTGIALDHLVGWLEASVGDLSDGELLVVGLLGRDDGSVSNQGEVDTGIGDQVGLELSEIDVEGTIEAKRSCDGADDLTDQPVKVGVGGTLDIEVTTADIVDGFVVDHESTVGVLQGGMCSEDGVVGLNHSSRNLGSGVDGELELGLLAVIDGKTFHEQRSESRSSAATEGVEDEESLETSALISQLPDAVEHQIDDLLSDGVVTTGVVVSGVLFACYQLLRVEQLTVSSGADLIDDGRLQVDEHGTGDVLASAGLAEEGVEGIITTSDGLVTGHLAIRLDSMLKTVQLPASVTDLDTGLSDVDGDAFTHIDWLVVFTRNRKK